MSENMATITTQLGTGTNTYPPATEIHLDPDESAGSGEADRAKSNELQAGDSHPKMELKTQDTRLKKMEQQVPPFERQFIGWAGNTWTPEQKAEAIRLNPDQRVFWRSLVSSEGTCNKLE